LLVFNDGNYVKTNIDIQFVIVHEIVDGTHQMLDLPPFQELGRIAKIKAAAGLYLHDGQNPFLSGYNIDFRLLKPEVPGYYLVTFFLKKGDSHLLALFSEYVVLCHDYLARF